MEMSTRHIVRTVLAAAHLALAAWCASGRATFPDNRAGQLLALYGTLSGAENQWGFFAPDVGWQVRPVFVLKDGAGRTWIDSIERGSNREANLRLGGIVDTMYALDEVDRNQIQSWAAAILGRNPEAVTLLVRIERYQIPTMAVYRRGERPEWAIVDTLTFSRAVEAAPDRK
jgi:hypothetical protein